MSELNGILTNFALDTIEEIRRNQASKGKKATGVSAENLTFSLINGVQIIDGSGYMYFQEFGRKAGGRPPISKIQEWIDAKGFDFNAWGVATNIAKKGTLLFQGKDEPLGLEDIFEENIEKLKAELADEGKIIIKDIIKKNIG